MWIGNTLSLFVWTQRISRQPSTSVTSLNASIVHPRECFKPAILINAASILVGHNHPTGKSAESKEDVEVTKRLVEAGKIIGIDVLDHIVLGDGEYVSMKEKGYL